MGAVMLAGRRVVDCSRGIGGMFCAKLFQWLGAELTQVARARRLPTDRLGARGEHTEEVLRDPAEYPMNRIAGLRRDGAIG